MLTRSYVNRLLKSIIDTGGLSEDMESALEKLRDDFDEREGILKKYGEVKDGEDIDEYEFEAIEQAEHTDTTDEDFKTKYEELRQKYRDRFWNGEEKEVEEDTTEIEDTEEAEETEEAKDIKIEDLFE